MGARAALLVRLAEGGAAVGAPSLAQREAEEEAQGEEEDGAQDSQAGEVVLQDADSADGTASFWLPADQTVTSHPFTAILKRTGFPHRRLPRKSCAADAAELFQPSFVSNLTRRWLPPPLSHGVEKDAVKSASRGALLTKVTAAS